MKSGFRISKVKILFLSRAKRESSASRESPRSYQDVYVRNRVSRYTPEPERSFIMHVHGSSDTRRDRPSSRLSNLRTYPTTMTTDTPFQRKSRG